MHTQDKRPAGHRDGRLRLDPRQAVGADDEPASAVPAQGQFRLRRPEPPIAVGVVAYVIAAVKIKVVTREDCLLLPKGEKIAKLLKL